MNFQYYQRAQLVENNNDDLFVVNSARASFARWQDEFDEEKDTRLINYLAKHKHISPFFQVRYTFSVDSLAFDLSKYLSDETYAMGAVIHHDKKLNRYLIKHSLYGWVRFLHDGVVNDAGILQHLLHFAPVSTKALIEHTFPINPLSLDVNMSVVETDNTIITRYRNDPYTVSRFIDFSVIFEVPIFVARQLYTHRMFAKNERSGRYVSEDIKHYFPDCWREKPHGSIKQGSGDCINIEMKDDEGTYNPIDALYGSLVLQSQQTYDRMINDYNVAPEMARMGLLQSMMSRFVFTGNYKAWQAMFDERSASGAQKETKEVVSDAYTQINVKMTKMMEM